jgi:hypothetical protein
MRAAHVIGMGASFVMLSAGAWLGCSSDSSSSTDAGSDSTGGSSSSGSSTTDAGSDSTGGSSSSGSGSSGGSSSSGGSGGGDAAAEAAPLTWTQVWADLVSPRCADCHGRLPTAEGGVRGGLRVGHLDLSTIDAGWASLIGVAAAGTGSPAAPDAAFCTTVQAGAAGSVRVVPFDAGASLLFLKVHGFVMPPPCGAAMPEPTPGPGEILDGGQAAAVTEVQNWINQGALP